MRRRRHSKKSSSSSAEVNMTPMIDMVFILLIFFIVTTSFVKETGVEVSRPSAQTAERKERGNILIAITKQGQIWIDRRLVDVSAVRANVERLHVENPEGAVIVQADDESKTGMLVKVIDQVRLAGISSISIAAQVQ
jgi:biopolymer transport protein ExbD